MIRLFVAMWLFLHTLVLRSVMQNVNHSIDAFLQTNQALSAKASEGRARFCQEKPQSHGACMRGLLVRDDERWRDACEDDIPVTESLKRYWRLDLRCEIPFLFSDPVTLRWTQVIYR